MGLLAGGGAVALLVAVGVVLFLVTGRSRGPAETASAAPSNPGQPAAAGAPMAVSSPPAHGASPAPVNDTAPAAPAVVAGPATEADCEALGRKLEEAVRRQDSAAVSGLFDFATVVARGAAGIDMPEPQKSQMLSGVRDGMAKGNFARELISNTAQGGRFDYVRVIEQDGGKRALFRLLRPVGGVDFLAILPGGGGEPRVIDVLTFSNGEDMSQILRRSLLSIAAQADQGLLARLTGAEPDLVKHGESIRQMAEKRLSGDWAGVVAIYDGLPESLRKEKFALLYALHASGNIEGGGDRYARMIEAFRDAYPGDSAVDLHMIDYHFLRDEYAAAADALRRLDARVGGDAYVRSMIAEALLHAGDHQAAGRQIEEAIGLEPDLAHPHVTAVLAAVVSGDDALAFRRLDDMRRQAAVPPQEFRTALMRRMVPEEANRFLATEQYRAWEAAAAAPG